MILNSWIKSLIPILKWIINHYWPSLFIIFLLPKLVFFFSKLIFCFSFIKFSHIILNQKIIYTKLFTLWKSINSTQNSSIFIKFSSLHSNHLLKYHLFNYLFNFFPKLFYLTFSCLRSIDSFKSESKSCIFSIQTNNYFYTISICHMNNLPNKYLKIQRKFLCLLQSN